MKRLKEFIFKIIINEQTFFLKKREEKATKKCDPGKAKEYYELFSKKQTQQSSKASETVKT